MQCLVRNSDDEWLPEEDLYEPLEETFRMQNEDVDQGAGARANLAAHELAASGAPAASGATIPRFHVRTEPPETLAQFAGISLDVEYSGRRH